MSDLISREAVNDTLIWYENGGKLNAKEAVELISKLPTIPAIPISVLEGIKAEIKQMRTDYCGGYIGLNKQEVLEIINEHIKEYEA